RSGIRRLPSDAALVSRYNGQISGHNRFVLPTQFQSELKLPGSGRRAGDHSGGGRNAGGRERDGIRRVEIRPVQDVEELRAELQVQSFTYPGGLQKRQVQSRQPRTNQRVSAKVSVEPAVVRRREKGRRIEPLARFAQNDRTGKCRVYERTHRVSRVAIVRRVVAELRSKR